jgi:hypothetical protein
MYASIIELNRLSLPRQKYLLYVRLSRSLVETNFTEHTSSEDEPPINVLPLWNPMIHFCIHKIPPVIDILKQINLLCIITSYFLRFLLILYICIRLFLRNYLCLEIFQRKFVLLYHVCYMPHPSHSPCLGFSVII